jgi:hypothetical protein
MMLLTQLSGTWHKNSGAGVGNFSSSEGTVLAGRRAFISEMAVARSCTG